MTDLTIVKPQSEAQKKRRPTYDSILVRPEVLALWQAPPFQRPLHVNENVKRLAEEIKASGVVPGVLTIAVMGEREYVLDGQHRLHAVQLSERQEVIADVRYQLYSSMAEMGAEFVRLNRRLTQMAPDDYLRALEGSLEPLRAVRNSCRFVGYGQIRRGGKAPILSMSVALRTWRGSGMEVPSVASGGAAAIAETLSAEEAQEMAMFLRLCHAAWGDDDGYRRLWGTLNLSLCGWLYRNMVMAQYSAKTARVDRELFKRCLMSLSAESDYLGWLSGRRMSDLHRAPAYARIKRIFVGCLSRDLGSKAIMPAPAWASG